VNDADSKIENTAAAGERAENTAARRRSAERNKREQQAALQVMLAEKQCRHCGTKGCWRITRTVERIRYLECLGCRRPDKIAVE